LDHGSPGPQTSRRHLYNPLEATHNLTRPPGPPERCVSREWVTGALLAAPVEPLTPLAEVATLVLGRSVAFVQPSCL
jgi:hypothetical protein